MTAEVIAFLVLAVQLLVIAVIDGRKMVIPDACNMLLAGSGLVAQWYLGRFDLLWSLAAIVVFGGTFALVRTVHFHARRQVGLGLGDVKMAAAAGCWITVGSFPVFLAASSLSALAFTLFMLPFWKQGAWMKRVPFGPFLAAGLLLARIFEMNSISLLDI